MENKEQVVIKNFSRVDQLIEFFPARNLKAESFIVMENKHLGAHRTINGAEVIGVLQSIAQIAVNDKIVKLRKDEMIYIPKGRLCNVYNNNKFLLKIILISSKL